MGCEVKLYEVVAIVVVCFIGVVECKEEFQLTIPNGRNVVHQGETWAAVGHNVPREPGPNAGNLNPFGKAAQATLSSNGDKPLWSALCQQDSDKDGKTNGEELGDPLCQWVEGDPDPVLPEGEFPSHPGFSEDEIVEFSTGPPKGFIAHATLMCLAWIVFAPAGIIAAMTQKKKPAVWGVWFKVHRVLVGTAVYFCLLAYVFMVNETGEFIKDSKHTRAGTGVVILSIIQPLSGFFRIHINKDGTKSKLRLLWEFQHQWTGRLTVFLAVLALYYGFELASDEFGYVKDETADAMKTLVVVLFALGALTSLLYVFLFREDTKLIGKKKAAPAAVNGAAQTGATGENKNGGPLKEQDVSKGGVTLQ